MNRFTREDILEIALYIRDEIYKPAYYKKTTVFLCGADINDKTKGRSKLSKHLRSAGNIELLFPEELFEELLTGSSGLSLLALENILAESADAIVILPESPGSFAELGAFSNNKALASKIVCIPDKKYKNQKSFINYGPNRLIKAAPPGVVIFADYEDFESTPEPIDLPKILSAIKKIKKSEKTTSKKIANILDSENFIIPCIHIIDSIGYEELCNLLQAATEQEKKICEIATRSALTRLTRSRLIMKTTSGYKISQAGSEYVRSTFNTKKLDTLRFEVINVETRRNARISRARLG